MAKTLLLLAEGFEEIEALTAADLLRRAGIACTTAALGGELAVTGAHGVTVLADETLDAALGADFDGVILPGGMPGTKHLAGDERVLSLLRRAAAAGKLTAAVCAAPTVLAQAGLLEGKRAVCFPGREGQMAGALLCEADAVTDGTVITGRSVGTAIPFALEIVRYFCGGDAADALSDAIVYQKR